MKRILTFTAALVFTLLAQAADLVTLPEGVVAEDYTLNITYAIAGQNGYQDNTKEFTTKVAFDGNDVYVAGLAYYFPSSYVKGTISGNQAIFASAQYLGADQYGDEYLSCFTLDGNDVVPSATFGLVYDAQARSFTFTGNVFIGETSLPNDGNLYAYVKSAVFTPGAVVRPQPVEVPENLETTDYMLMATYVVNEPDETGQFHLTSEPYQIPVSVGFDGDDLYIQGLVENVPESWAKATKNAQGNYVLSFGQYAGTVVLYGENYDYYLAAVSRMNKLEDLVFTYHPEDGSITSTQTMVVNRNKKTLEAYYWLKDIAIKKVAEKEATPANPQFTFHAEPSPYGSTTWYYASVFIPLVDTEDVPLATDKLSYMFYYKKDGQELPVTFPKSKYYMLENDMTEIPFGFTDKLDIGLHFIYFEKLGISELQSWTALGLQSIYRGNDVEHRSDITWVDLTEFWQTQGISTVSADRSSAKTAIYNLSGQRLQQAKKGLNIINGKKVIVR